MYALRTPADAEPFIDRLRHAIARKQPMTITYLKMSTNEIVTRTIEPYDIDMTADRIPVIRAIDRSDGTPKTWHMQRVMFYTPHRSARLMEHAY